MQRPLVSFPIRQQILPVDHVALNGPKRDARVVSFIAVDELAPSFIPRRIQNRKVGASARHVVCLDVSEKGADAVPAVRCRGVGLVCEPVRVEVVPFSDCVLDELDGLEV